MTTAKKPYHFTECGLDNVYLLNGFHIHETESGKGISFEDLEELHRAIALHLVRCDTHLSGKEFRFLRKELDASQEMIARLFGVDAQSVARWEKGQSDLKPLADRMIRLLYMEQILGNPKVKNLLDLVATLSEQGDGEPPKHFKYMDGEWRVAA